MPPVNETLERVIFGGSDSELSDEDDFNDRHAPTRYRPDDDESSGGESGDDYMQERSDSGKSGRRKGKARASGERAQRKRRRPEPIVEENLDDLPPEVAAKRALDMKIDAILKPNKANRPKKRKKDDEDVLDRFADEEVSRLREAMLIAAQEDENANKEKYPATAKLKLLPQVLEVLRKSSLAQSIIDNNLLEGVRRWLEPLPDRSLPALNIQQEFFPILRKMEFIDSSVLKESGLGRIVLFYTKCKRVTAPVQRQAHDLISIWTRPIIKRSASYRDRVIPTAQTSDGGKAQTEKLNAILARAREADKNRVRKNAVAIPTRELGTYTVAPRLNSNLMSQNTSVDADVERRRRNAERMRLLTRKVTTKG